ncbi:Coenzyme F420 hydrogenase/dehydrogenase, beta subunit N-term [Musa troglodytarum]|uniref:Coenzyme F420 hydrogenase/dehydrogenase, beta subunit N-term n=1 Tax=Musa troglodytarum TaxID=320322 RepID=A0A9E7FFF3_9LILI|nr:Coenzyme F420 hydrogenase/dehydrogenase, beta subunit N-term [Musa troglodytarum]
MHQVLEPTVHGRGRTVEFDEIYFGVHEQLLYAKKIKPVEGAQWTRIVTTIAVEMLKANMVDAVICVQSDPDDRLTPRPILARTPDEVYAAKGVKPTLSPNLDTLALVEAAGVKRLLFCGVGCQVQALRSVEKYLDLDKLYVLGTNCVDNGTREGLEKFLKAASSEPETVLHYEFMQDYKVHLKHLDGHIEEVPYFSCQQMNWSMLLHRPATGTSFLSSLCGILLINVIVITVEFARIGGSRFSRYRTLHYFEILN